MTEATEWDRRYAATGRLFHSDPDTALVEFVTPLTPGRAVDLGAGEGRNSLWLARRGWDVVAVDTSRVALERVRETAVAEGLNVETVQADIGDFLGREERFDLVVVANIHPTPTDRTSLLAAAAGAVASSGHLFLVGHHLDSLGLAGPPHPERLYTEERLRHAFPGLRIERIERRERPRDRGGEVLLEPKRASGQGGEVLVDIIVWAAAPA